MFQITDDETTHHIGTEQEMQLAYIIMAWDEKTLHRMFQDTKLTELKEKYRRPTVGKIKMVPYVQTQEGPNADNQAEN